MGTQWCKETEQQLHVQDHTMQNSHYACPSGQYGEN